MMKKFFTWNMLLTAAMALLLTGCGRDEGPAAANPEARNQLILRLFESMDKRDYAASSQQAIKLRALDPGSIFLSRMVDIQTGNHAVVQAQQRLDVGDYRGAAGLVEDAARRNPLYREMEAESRKARRVAELAQMVAEYRDMRQHKDVLAAAREKDPSLHEEYFRALIDCARQLHQIGGVAREFKHAGLTRTAEMEFALINRESAAERKRHAAEQAAAEAAKARAAGENAAEYAGEPTHVPAP